MTGASDLCCLQALAEVLLEALALGRLAAPAGGADAACSGSDDDLVCLTPAPDAHARLRESLAALLAAHRELSGALRRAGPLRCLLLRVRGALGGREAFVAAGAAVVSPAHLCCIHTGLVVASAAKDVITPLGHSSAPMPEEYAGEAVRPATTTPP